MFIGVVVWNIMVSSSSSLVRWCRECKGNCGDIVLGYSNWVGLLGVGL